MREQSRDLEYTCVYVRVCVRGNGEWWREFGLAGKKEEKFEVEREGVGVGWERNESKDRKREDVSLPKTVRCF